MSKRTYARRADLFNSTLQRPIPVIRPVTSPLLSSTTITRAEPSSSSTSTSSFGRTNSSTNDLSVNQKIAALEALVKRVVEENASLKSTVEDLKIEVEQLRETQDQSIQKADELENILKSRRNKVQTAAIFRSTPEMTAANIQVRFSSEIATFFLKDFVNFDMENKALEEVAKLIAIKMFEQLIPEGCTLANFSTSSTPRYGYITVPSNLFDELAEKLVVLTQGHEDQNLKHALLLRINFGLNDKIQRARKNIRITEHTPEA